MDPVVWLALAILIVLIVLRIFFKLARFVLVMGVLIVIGIVLWNILVAST